VRFGGGGGIGGLSNLEIIVKPLDTRRTEDIVVSDDPDIQAELLANRTYGLKMDIFMGTLTTVPDMKWIWSIPAGSTISWTDSANGSGVSLINGEVERVIQGAADPTLKWVQVNGIIKVVGAGDLILQWAQNNSNTDFTDLKAGTSLSLWEAD